MALPIDDMYIKYYPMDTFRLIQFGHIYFESPHYLAVFVWISEMIPDSDTVTLTRTKHLYFCTLLSQGGEA